MAELLLVDNDARIVELVALFLERRGHHVRRAGSYREARTAIGEARPDLMLADVELGSEHGGEELPALARAGLLPPTLVVSGYLDRTLEDALRALPGIVGTLKKPFGMQDLEARIASALALATSAAPNAARGGSA